MSSEAPTIANKDEKATEVATGPTDEEKAESYKNLGNEHMKSKHLQVFWVDRRRPGGRLSGVGAAMRLPPVNAAPRI